MGTEFIRNTIAQLRAPQTGTERIRTYTNWSSDTISKDKLANAGFSYTNCGDAVKCRSCSLTLDMWQPTDDPLQEHQTRRPECPFIRALFPQVQSHDTCGVYYDGNYSSLANRIASFKTWPKSLSQRPKDLAQAGFYYTGESDKVICFDCGVGLNDWEPQDDPWLEHEKYSKECYFLRRGGNKKFLEQKNMKTKECEKYVSDDMACVVCRSAKKNMLSLPCRHVCTCEKCNDELTSCPMCRKLEQQRMKIYL